MLSCEYMAKTSVPVEIWREIWTYCQPAELKAISCTCHLFREICLPMLFANLRHTFKIEEEQWVSWELWSVMMLLCSRTIQRLAASPKHATLLRRWEVSVIAPITLAGLRVNPGVTKDGCKLLEVSRQLYSDSVLQNLSAFTSLRTIEITFFDIGEVLLNALKGLPALENLICLWTTFSCFSITPSLPLREFKMDSDAFDLSSTDNISFDIISNSFLERLDISSDALPSIFASLSNQGPCENLSELSLDIRSVEVSTLFKFLPFCPRLRKLSLANYYVWSRKDPIGDVPPLPNSVIPHLQSFSGHGRFAEAIIPGRPVEIVSIIGQKWVDFNRTIAILKSITQSTLPIYDLTLPLMQTDPKIILFIYTYLPKLRYLRLGFTSTPKDISASLTLLSQPAQPTVTTQDDAGNMVTVPECHPDAGGKPHVYAQLLDMLCSNELSLPSGLQALEICDGGGIENLVYEDTLEGCDTGLTDLHYRDYLDNLSVLYPSLTVAVMGKHYSYNAWVKHSGGYWVGVSRYDSRLSHFIRKYGY
ncbi:hypothetical protein BYT27DRAFT_7341144 [Phlegmacium glaucopus]|nr:hypothetical protein BYT27DRAFT_7341144 [Phlegmacium glaucopus]